MNTVYISSIVSFQLILQIKAKVTIVAQNISTFISLAGSWSKAPPIQPFFTAFLKWQISPATFHGKFPFQIILEMILDDGW